MSLDSEFDDLFSDIRPSDSSDLDVSTRHDDFTSHTLTSPGTNIRSSSKQLNKDDYVVDGLELNLADKKSAGNLWLTEQIRAVAHKNAGTPSVRFSGVDSSDNGDDGDSKDEYDAAPLIDMTGNAEVHFFDEIVTESHLAKAIDNAPDANRVKSNSNDVDGEVEREAEVGGEGDRRGRTTRSCSLPVASRPFRVSGDATDTDSEITDRDEHDGRDVRRLSSVPGKRLGSWYKDYIVPVKEAPDAPPWKDDHHSQKSPITNYQSQELPAVTMETQVDSVGEVEHVPKRKVVVHAIETPIIPAIAPSTSKALTGATPALSDNKSTVSTPTPNTVQDFEDPFTVLDQPHTPSTKTPVQGGIKIPVINTNSSGAREECHGCGKVIYEEEKVANNNVVYHSACFRCHRCRFILRGTSFVTVDDKHYCSHRCANILRPTPSIANDDFEVTLPKIKDIKHMFEHGPNNLPSTQTTKIPKFKSEVNTQATKEQPKPLQHEEKSTQDQEEKKQQLVASQNNKQSLINSDKENQTTDTTDSKGDDDGLTYIQKLAAIFTHEVVRRTPQQRKSAPEKRITWSGEYSADKPGLNFDAVDGHGKFVTDSKPAEVGQAAEIKPVNVRIQETIPTMTTTVEDKTSESCQMKKTPITDKVNMIGKHDEDEAVGTPQVSEDDGRPETGFTRSLLAQWRARETSASSSFSGNTPLRRSQSAGPKAGKNSYNEAEENSKNKLKAEPEESKIESKVQLKLTNVETKAVPYQSKMENEISGKVLTQKTEEQNKQVVDVDKGNVRRSLSEPSKSDQNTQLISGISAASDHVFEVTQNDADVIPANAVSSTKALFKGRNSDVNKGASNKVQQPITKKANNSSKIGSSKNNDDSKSPVVREQDIVRQESTDVFNQRPPDVTMKSGENARTQSDSVSESDQPPANITKSLVKKFQSFSDKSALAKHDTSKQPQKEEENLVKPTKNTVARSQSLPRGTPAVNTSSVIKKLSSDNYEVSSKPAQVIISSNVSSNPASQLIATPEIEHTTTVPSDITLLANNNETRSSNSADGDRDLPSVDIKNLMSKFTNSSNTSTEEKETFAKVYDDRNDVPSNTTRAMVQKFQPQSTKSTSTPVARSSFTDDKQKFIGQTQRSAIPVKKVDKTEPRSAMNTKVAEKGKSNIPVIKSTQKKVEESKSQPAKSDESGTVVSVPTPTTPTVFDGDEGRDIDEVPVNTTKNMIDKWQLQLDKRQVVERHHSVADEELSEIPLHMTSSLKSVFEGGNSVSNGNRKEATNKDSRMSAMTSAVNQSSGVKIHEPGSTNAIVMSVQSVPTPPSTSGQLEDNAHYKNGSDDIKFLKQTTPNMVSELAQLTSTSDKEFSLLDNVELEMDPIDSKADAKPYTATDNVKPPNEQNIEVELIKWGDDNVGTKVVVSEPADYNVAKTQAGKVLRESDIDDLYAINARYENEPVENKMEVAYMENKAMNANSTDSLTANDDINTEVNGSTDGNHASGLNLDLADNQHEYDVECKINRTVINQHDDVTIENSEYQGPDHVESKTPADDVKKNRRGSSSSSSSRSRRNSQSQWSDGGESSY